MTGTSWNGAETQKNSDISYPLDSLGPQTSKSLQFLDPDQKIIHNHTMDKHNPEKLRDLIC